MDDTFKYLKIIIYIIIFSLLVHYGYISFSNINFILMLLYTFTVRPILYLYDTLFTVISSLFIIPKYIYQLLEKLFDSIMTIFGFVFSVINYLSILILHVEDDII
jgi:hypothetical protein